MRILRRERKPCTVRERERESFSCVLFPPFINLALVCSAFQHLIYYTFCRKVNQEKYMMKIKGDGTEIFEQSARKSSAEGSETELFHFRSGVESDGDHLGEAELALFGREHLVAVEMVGHGTDAEGTFAEIGGIGIETGSLHLDAQNTHLLPFVILFGSGVKSGIEIVGRENIANVDVDAEGSRRPLRQRAG